MATKKHDERAEWIKNITRDLEGLEEGPRVEIHIDLLKTTLKRIPNWKTPGHDEIHGFWFKKFTSIHVRLALEMNRCLQGAQVPDWMTKGWLDDHIDTKGPKQRNYSKQLQTNNLPTNHVENNNCTNKRKDFRLTNKPWIVPWRTERMPQKIKRHSRITLRRSTHPEWEQDPTEKSSYGLDWLQKHMAWLHKAG